MRNRRKFWLLRRVVLGLAIVAVAAPAAQARVDEGKSSQPVFVQGITDFPRYPVGSDVSGSAQGGPIRADDKLGIGRTPQSVPVRGDDKTGLGRTPQVALIHDRPSYEPTVGAEYSQFAYRRALPSDYGVAPVQLVRADNGFDWGDAGIGAGLAFALILLAGGAALGTRQLGRPASA